MGSVQTADSLIVLDDGKRYWEGVEATVNGMLGGHPFLSEVDLKCSGTFLARLGYGLNKQGRKPIGRALEGGAGIGRVTEGLLLKRAACVDVIEPVAKFTTDLATKDGVGKVYNVGLEGWHADEGISYDLIWVQWCAMYLPDKLLVEFLERCKAALKPRGHICFKENIGTIGEDVFDEEDSSVTREGEKFEALFEQAGLRLVRKEVQDFPLVDGRPLYPVMMYALENPSDFE